MLLDRAALSGLNVVFRAAPNQAFQGGCIQLYDENHDCFIVSSGPSNAQYQAIQFKQFTVEQDAGQIVLRVPKCVHTALPQPYQAVRNEGVQCLHSEETGAQSCSRASSGMAQASNQLSSVLSQQLSGLIGRCFSQTDEGFEAAAPSQQAPAAGSNTAATKQQPLHVQVHRPSRHSTDSAHDDSSYWGSPVKHDSSAGNTATCSLAATTAEMVPPCSTAPSSTATCHQQQQSSTTATSSIPAPAAQAQPAEAACTPPAPVAAAPASQAVSFSSFQEISRMISHGEDSSPLARPSSIKTSMPPGLAARLLDEQASWGTPQENSPWGTPREQQLGSNATNTPTSGSVDQQGSNPGHHFSGPAVHKLMFGGEQLHSRLEAAVSGKQLAEHLEQQPQQQQPISLPAAAAVLPADVLGVSKAAPAKPAAAPAAPTAGELEPAAAVAAAVAAVDAAAAETEADSFGDLDFTIPVAMDVQPRPHSRGSSRIREVYRASNTSASNTGMVVDVPQPLTSRHTGLMRSPGRSLPAPSDPGHMGTASAFSHAASMSAAQVSASVGGAAGFEQRRTATNIGPGLGSFGGSHAASRRMSRNASSRLNADQDWALLGPDGQLLQQQLAAMQVPQQRVSLGQVLHAPGVGSRRTSRTLSGRLALDQDAAAVLMEQLDDSEPDVLSRPVAPAAPGLDTIISRRQSTSNGRGTPDSDGFGFSEFEGLEPLVPPEEAAAAALTEAAAAAAAAAAATDGGAADGMNSSASSSMGALHHHRVHRRSARSLGVPPPVNMGHRPSMRLSDQDPGHHGLAALPAMTAAAVAAAAAARAHTSAASGLPGPRIVGYDVVSTPLPEEEDAAGMEVEGQAANSSSTPAPAAAGTPVRLGSRTNSTGAAAAGSPLQSATGGSSTRAASGSLDGSCRSSKRSIPSIFQAAAAVAAAAEAAAAAAVGYALGGRDRTSGEQQALDKAAQGAEADGKVQAAAAVEQVEDPEQLQESVFAAPSFLKQRLGGGGEGLGSVDSFTCPPFMPLAGSITVTGSRSGLSVAASNTSSAVSSSNGSQPGPVAGSGDTAMAAELAAADASLGQAVAAGLAGAPAFPGHAYAMAAATAAGAIAADGELHATGVYGSPAANIGSFIAAAAGSPSAATAALLRRQQLLSSEGSEWGSGALGSHLHLSTSGIDSPTGSAVFRLGGNSPHPLDTCDSAGGGASVAPGELTAALESLAVQSGCGTGGSKPIGIGASRMAREAAAAAGHAGSLTNQGVSLPAGSGYSNGPVGAAALLLGTQGAAVLNKGLAAGLSEITPAADDEEPGGGMISAKYPSDSGNNPAAGAVFFRLAGGPAPGDTTTATAQQGAGEMALQRSSSSGSGAAISKVLGKIAVGKAPLLPKPAAQSSSSSTLSRQVAAGSGGVAASQGSDACSNIGSEAAPPSYVESVGGDADDEQSPYGHHAAVSSRRVWPAQYAAETEAAAAASGDDNASIRQSAALGRASHTAGLAASQRQEQQVVEEEDAGSPERPSTGLVRRTPHTSRTPSQSLPPGMRPSLESLGLLGGRSFHYEDCDDLPLMRGTVTSVAEQEAGAVFDARSQVGRVVLHAFLTLSAQWFDISALVVLGPQLAGAMLAPETPQLQQLRSLFGIFALGHVLWLLGCFLWPWRAAALGRKGLLAWTLGLSGFCTALMACMPSYAEAGAAGIGIITLLRVVSGAAVGNTAPAALVYLTEHAPQCPSLHASLVPASMAAGACAASSLALLLSWVMGPAVLAASGWRVVLVMSLLGNAITGWLRGYVLQEPEGKMQAAELLDRSNAHVGTILWHHAPQVLLAVLLQAFAVSGLYLLTAWLPSYFMQLAGMTPSTALLMHTLNMAALTGSMPLGGLLADEWERTPVLLATCVTAVGFGYPAWLLFSLGVAEVTWFAQCILCVLVGLHWGALTGALADLFPLGMRCSAMAVAHMVPMVALGATAPLMAVGFIAQSGSLAAPALVSIIMAVVTAAAVSWQSWRTAARGLQF